MRHHGRPITGVEYQRLPQGPAPRRLLPVRDRLIARGGAELRAESYGAHEQDRLVARRSADLSVFDAEELATIDRTLSELGHLNGAQLSALSHAEAGWRYRTDSETIPYSSAFVRLATPGPGTSALAKQALADLPPKIADRR